MQSLLQAGLIATFVRERRANDERRRKAVAEGLLAVARRCGPRANPRQRGVLLIHRAAAVRPRLLELSAVLRAAPEPDRDVIAALQALLKDGCSSPLYNPDVPAEQLSAVLMRARVALAATRHNAHATASSIPVDTNFQW